MRYPEYRYIFIGLALAVLATCAQSYKPMSGTKTVELPKTWKITPRVKPVYSPPQDYDPIRNWWGTIEDPVVWPE